jgi:hypothetical protein
MSQTNAAKADKLARLSSDCSFLLTHLVRQNGGRPDAEARRILLSILDADTRRPKPYLKASQIGWYSKTSSKVFNPETCEFNGSIKSGAVCFTESTLQGLKAHCEVFDSKYGIAFDRDLLFNRGANPCLNIRESLFKESIQTPIDNYSRHVFNFIPYQLQPFVNIIHESFDATHEREWRYPGDLPFRYKDVLFVFCPERIFRDFAQSRDPRLEFLDSSAGQTWAAEYNLPS